MNQSKQRGAALILTMILLAVLSVMTVSMMFLSQSETWSTANYRLMSQARDAAEAGVNKTAHFILYSYNPPQTPAQVALFDRTVYPVTSGNAPVVLSADPDVAPNYPIVADQTAFDTAGTGAKGTLTAGTQPMTYESTARMLTMNMVTNSVLGDKPALRWELTSGGKITGIQGAEVEISAIIDQPMSPLFGYAVFATYDSSNCSTAALDFGSGATTGSYDSSAVVPGVPPVILQTDGDVGTNGTLGTSGGNTTIYGSLSTPRTGVGTNKVCDSSDNPLAWQQSSGTVTEGVIKLPQALDYPTPPAPVPLPPTGNLNLNNNCGSLSPLSCNYVNPNFTLQPTCAASGIPPAASPTCPVGSTNLYPDITVNAGKKIHLGPGTYNFNSLKLGAGAELVVDGGPIVINIAGTGLQQSAPALDLGSGIVTNVSLNSSNLTFMYAGKNEVKLSGGAATASVVYAPNADIKFSGGGTFYGSIVGRTVTVTSSNLAINYDNKLKKKFYFPGQYMMQAFTWKKF
ncbi:MAG: pilus assembly PilX N-terminal domain-containing protein [Acidobacteria bacterium]|nr:pilus assembly PilX N-terminal domain-containing protein [Acidobacteriota bacterium]